MRKPEIILLSVRTRSCKFASRFFIEHLYLTIKERFGLVSLQVTSSTNNISSMADQTQSLHNLRSCRVLNLMWHEMKCLSRVLEM